MIVGEVERIRGKKTQENEVLCWGHSMWMPRHWPPMASKMDVAALATDKVDVAVFISNAAASKG